MENSIYKPNTSEENPSTKPQHTKSPYNKTFNTQFQKKTHTHPIINKNVRSLQNKIPHLKNPKHPKKNPPPRVPEMAET